MSADNRYVLQASSTTCGMYKHHMFVELPYVLPASSTICGMYRHHVFLELPYCPYNNHVLQATSTTCGMYRHHSFLEQPYSVTWLYCYNLFRNLEVIVVILQSYDNFLSDLMN